MTGRLLGREPVMTISTIVALLIALLPVFGWPAETVGAVAGALVLAGGALEAALVSVDRALPLLVGVAKAVLAAVAAFGLNIPDNHVAALMAVLTVVAGLATRAQVGAVQPPTDRDGRSLFGLLPAPRTLTEHETAEFRDRWSASFEREGPEAGQHSRTEVFGAVSADGPLPEHRESDGDREHRARHRLRGSYSGELRPDFGM